MSETNLEESGSESGSEILDFFQNTEDEQNKIANKKRPLVNSLIKTAEETEELKKFKENTQIAKTQKEEPIEREESLNVPSLQTRAAIDSRVFFEDEDDFMKKQKQTNLPSLAAKQLFECHFCMQRLQVQLRELDIELIKYVYPNEKDSIEVCKTCIRRDKVKAVKLEKINNKVEYNLMAKSLMPDPCKICGSYEHGSYECMIPESRDFGEDSKNPEFDPTAPYR